VVKSRAYADRWHQPWRWAPFPLRLAVARGRVKLARHRLVRRAALLLVATAVVMVVVGSLSRAAEVRDRWGTMVDVVIAERDLAAGSPLAPGSLTIAHWPAALVAADALGELPSADDSLRRTLRLGEVVTLRDLRSTSAAMEVPSGRRAISMPMDASVPSLVAGDIVDFFVFEDVAPGLDVNRAPNFDASGIVIEVSHDSFVVAVLESRAGDVAHATQNRSVVVALRSAADG
jgi:hypothetical protein